MEENKKIKAVLSRLKEAGEILESDGAGIFSGALEKDLVLEKLRALYEKVLNSAGEISAFAESSRQEEIRVKNEQYHEPAPGVLPAEEQVTEIADETRLQTGAYHEAEPVPEPAPVKNEKPGEPVKQKREPGVLGEKYLGGQSSIHENISQSRTTKDLSSKLQSKPIHDLTKAIGINDKFLFIKELFRGDTGLYESTVREINSSADMTRAMECISSFNWDREKPEVAKFIELINRKFTTHA